jgi:EmrB/QacA subfamily drug resistance transporter
VSAISETPPLDTGGLETIAAGAGTPTVQRGPSPRTVLAIASLGASVAFVDATIVNIAFPNIEHAFPGTAISSLSWVLNVYNIVFAAFLVAAGRVADLLGRRRIFIFGLELFTLASLLCALSPSVSALIGFRVLQAFGAALLVPSSLALVLNAFPPDQRAHGVALLSAVAAAAAGLGPSLGGLLVTVSSWRLVFLVNVPLGALAVLLARRHLVESRAPGRRLIPDLAGALVFALAISACVLGVVKGQEWGWTGVPTLGSFAAAAALLTVFVRRCRWHRSPILELSLLRIRTFSAANGMSVVAAAGFYGYMLTNVLFLTGVWRYSALQAGLALTPGPLMAAAVAGPTSALARRIGHRPVLMAGGLIWSAAVLWLIEVIGTTPAFLSEWLPGILLLGLGAGTLLPNLSGAAIASAPGDSFGTATALNAVSRQVGAAFGVAIVVAIIGRPSPLEALSAFDNAWTFGAVCLLIAGLGCVFVGKLTHAAPTSLNRAARVVLGDTPSVPVPLRTRRAIVIPDSTPAAARVESAADFLARVPLLLGLERGLLEALASKLAAVRVAAGDWLFHEGDAGDAMYIVRAGRLQVVDEASGVTIRELGRGDALGELALISGSPRSASVRALRSSDMLAIARVDFEALMREAPELSFALNRVLAQQLRESRASTQVARPRPTTVALVALSDSVALEEIAQKLTTALERQMSPALLDGREVDAGGHAAGTSSVYGPLLDRAEGAHDIVILSAGTLGAGGAWSEFCLQQADRILVVTAGGPLPDGIADRTELRGCDLVAYEVTPGAGELAQWCECLEPIESHTLRRSDFDADIERIARRLSGRSVGIVLSGGGARAFSHIGVLEELVAAGLKIDRVLGVSMGAFIGALFSMGMDGEEMDVCCFEEWVQRRPLGDYTLPRRGLIRGQRVEAMLQRTFGERAIEELDRSFMCGCAELRSGRLVIARSGPLWEAVGFSISVPVLAPPQTRGRELFIDGSLVDNLPVETMSQMGEGPIIAVDVKATFGPADGEPPRPGKRLARAHVPGLGETLTRVLLLGSSNTSQAAREHADILIKPRAEGVGLLEFHQLDTAREAGRLAAREALETGLGELFG